MTARIVSGVGGGGASKQYVDDVFSAYTYTGNGTTKFIKNGINLSGGFNWYLAKIRVASTNQGNSIALDNAGNLYTGGYCGAYNALVTKHDISGNLTWQRTYSQTPYGSIKSIAVTTAGNVYSAGQGNETNASGLLCKYDNSGTVQWKRALYQGSSSNLFGVALDTSENVYVTGYCNDGTSYAIIAKYDSSGTLQWQRKLRNLGSAGRSIAVGASGAVYVTADVNATNDGLICKYTSAGALSWQRLIKQGGTSAAQVAVNASEDIYVCGSATSTAFLIKYNSSGALQWQRTLRQSTYSSLHSAIALDGSGNVYVSGQIYDSLTQYACVSKYDASGNLVWQRRLRDNTNNIAYGVVCDTSGWLYITGVANDTIGGYQFIVRLAQDGSSTEDVALDTEMSLGRATSTTSTITDSAGTATDSAGTATDSASGVTVSAGSATCTIYTRSAGVSNPYLIWSKSRNTADGSVLVDSVRGTAILRSNTIAAEAAGYSDISNTYPGGYVLGFTGGYANDSGADYISWTFRKARKFFDVVTYTGNATAGRAIPHSLGVKPGMIIVKQTNANQNWYVWHKSLSVETTSYLILQSTAAAADYALWNTAPDANNFYLSAAVDVNISGGTFIAYVFAHDTGIDNLIQCGSFTTDGSGNSAVTLGWEPQFLLVKGTAASPWRILDSTRNFIETTAGSSHIIPNTTDAEATNGLVAVGPTATGFKIAGYTTSTTNIYLAIRRPNKPPTVGTQVYNAITRTGTGAAATVTGVGFAPDLVLSEERSLALYEPVWHDRLRGASKQLLSNSTAAEYNQADLVTAFNMDGVALGADATFRDINYSAYTYINHFFKRAPGVFDVVCYTGTGVAKTEAHGLGVVPELMLVKTRGAIGTAWEVYHGSLTTSLQLNSSTSPIAGTPDWGSTYPTASVFTIGTGAPVNNNASLYVAYLFATKAGISKVGSYTGNNSSQTINCGFTTGARFILIKRTDSTGDWFVFDTARGIVAGNDPHLSLNSTAAEVATDDSIDPDTSGFIVNQVAATNLNVTSATYIYLSMA